MELGFPEAMVIVVFPSALELFEVFTVTVWGTFQLSGVKVSELGDIEVTPSLDDDIGIVTGAVGA